MDVSLKNNLQRIKIDYIYSKIKKVYPTRVEKIL